MQKNYLPILKIKGTFFGVSKGFEFLDLFLDQVKQLKNKKTNNYVKIYDYRSNKSFDIRFENRDFYFYFQDFYLDFLIKNRLVVHEWFQSFCAKIYFFFGKNPAVPDDFCDVLIKTFTKAFLLLCNFDNKIKMEKFTNFVSNNFCILTGNEEESISYTKFIMNKLIDSKLIIVKDDIFSLNDRFIFIDFFVTSLNVSFFYSDNSYDLKYSCTYGFDTLLQVIDSFFTKLIENNSFDLAKELFSYQYQDSFSFLMNYEDLNFSKIQDFVKPYDDLFNAFLFKKLLLNEYCFHTVIMSCFETYYFNNKIKNILIEKNDPNLGLTNDITYIFLK